MTPLYGTYNNAGEFFAVGRAAMWIGSLPNTGRRGRAPWGFEWGAAPLPQDKAEGAQMWVSQYYYVTMRSSHPNEAWSWIRYLVSQPVSRGLPPLRSVAESNAYRSEVGDELADAAIYAVEHAMPPLDDADIPSREIADAYAVAVESILGGELLAAEALEALTAQVGE